MTCGEFWTLITATGKNLEKESKGRFFCDHIVAHLHTLKQTGRDPGTRPCPKMATTTIWDKRSELFFTAQSSHLDKSRYPSH